MSLKRALLAATILAVPAAASAQPVTGLYIGAGAGANFINNPRVGPERLGRSRQFWSAEQRDDY